MKSSLTILFFGLFYSSVFGQTLFWIDGGGNWVDSSHWSYSSGGASCMCIPDQGSDVVFDNNSFASSGQVVTINQPVEANDVSWIGVTNMPTMAGGGRLNIYGSITLTPDMIISFTGEWYFKSGLASETITTAGHVLSLDMYFDSPGGGWTLMDSLKTAHGASGIYLLNGSLNTNSQYVYLDHFNSTGSGIRTLNLGSSLIELLGTPFFEGWNVSGTNITVNAGTSLIRVKGNYPGFINEGFTYYDVEFTSPIGDGFLGAGTYHNCNFTNRIDITSSTMNDVWIGGDGVFNGDCSFHNLSLTQNKTYTFDGLSTQTFSGSIVANGNCAEPINIMCWDGAVLFSKASGIISLDYARLRGIHSIGGATFIANNGQDLGGNSGWLFNAPPNQTFYWVGDSGSWSDVSNWSFSSGGTSGNCLPTIVNDVVFDSNSFSASGQIVFLDKTAYCKSMNWTGVTNMPAFSGNEILVLHGSLNLTDSMILNITGGMSFGSTLTGETITTSGQSISSGLIFNGEGGSWTLQDSLIAAPTNVNMILYNGTLNTNGQYIRVAGFHSTGSGIRSLILGSSTIEVTGSSFILRDSNLTISEGTSLIKFTSMSARLTNNGFKLYDVDFTNPTGSLTIETGTYHNCNFAGKVDFYPIICNDVYLGGDGVFHSNSHFNNLTLSANNKYTINGPVTQTIYGSLTANGTCSRPITIESSFGFSSILKTSGNITLNYVILKNVHGVGGASFIANNSIDLGGNSGWILNAPIAKTLYWIGNTGNWNSSSHWSGTSGGSSAGCIPTIYDNVVFDSNSFSVNGQNVVIDEYAYCKNMTWLGVTNSPTLSGTEEIEIYGSLTLSRNMNLTYTGQIYFKADTLGATISSAGRVFRSYLYFDGIGGGWTLQDSLLTYANTGYIYLQNGNLNTNGQYVSAYGLTSVGLGVRSLNLGSSTIVITGPFINFSGQNLIVNAGTSLIRFTYSSSELINNGQSFNDVEFTDIHGHGVLRNGTYRNCTFANAAHLYSSTFNDVVIEGGGLFSGDCTFNNLTLSPGRIYFASSLSTQTFNGDLIATGSLNNRIEILSQGTHSIFSKTNGDVCADWLKLTNIHTSGGGTFFAGVNSTNLGNNIGWQFSSCSGCAPVNITNTLLNQSAFEGDTITLTVNTSGSSPFSYQWYRNNSIVSGANGQHLTLPSLTLSDSGATYHCYITNCSGSFSDSTNVAMLNVFSQDSISSALFNSLDSVLCDSGLVSFYDLSTGNPISIEWIFPGGLPSSSTDSIPLVFYGAVGVYDVTLITTYATKIDTLSLPGFINVTHSPVSIISLINDTLISSYTNGVIYYWYHNNTLIDSTASNFILPDSTGIYFVQVIDSAGCSANSTSIYYSTTNIISILDKAVISVYPNPGTEYIHVSGKGLDFGVYNLNLSNTLGQVLREIEFTYEKESFEQLVDLSEITEGVYYLTIYSNKVHKTFKVQKAGM